jgi:RNA polymerase primary sigma factor
MATKVKEAADDTDNEREGTSPDGPLLDLSDDAVKKMIKTSKKRGYVTMDELNAVLPSEEVTSEQIEDILSMLSDMGINVVEEDEAGEDKEADDDSDSDSEGGELATASGSAVTATARRKSRPTAPTIRCACICAKWARWSFCRAKAKSPSPSASRPAARP